MTTEDTQLHTENQNLIFRKDCDGCTERGGLYTISPPAKVKSVLSDPFQVLASGIDTLDLSLYVFWENNLFFETLERMKDLAIQENQETAITLRNNDEEELLRCLIMPYGLKGHAWVLRGSEYKITIGNWVKPQSRPSILVNIRSETLWRFGPENAVKRLISIFTQLGANLESVKVSRVDICVDMTFPEEQWTEDLRKLRVTRSRYSCPHYENDKLTGISIGKGKVSARLYDKFLEINQKSKKFWMLDIWGIKEAPDGQRIIRIEFQLRREALKDLGLDSVNSLFRSLDSLWGYCSQKWLKFQNNPGKHHTQRRTLPWWIIIQNAFLGVKSPKPLLRKKLVNPQIKQHLVQSYGYLTSLAALHMELMGYHTDHEATLIELVSIFLNLISDNQKDDFKVSIDVLDKRAKYHRIDDEAFETYCLRSESGFPTESAVIEKAIKKKCEELRWKSISQQRN